MTDLSQLGAKFAVTSPRVLRKAKEYCQLVDIRSSSASLAALKLTGSCKTVACLELAASACSAHIDKNAAIRTSGTTKKLYTMCLKTIESILDIQQVQTVRDLAVQFGCTGAVTLAQQVLKKYQESQAVDGDDMDFNTSLFQGAALCVACKKLKIKVERVKLKELCAVKKTCFELLVADMEKLAVSIEGEKKVQPNKRSKTLMDDVERKMQEVPEKQQKRSNDDEDEEDGEKTDYEEWKRKILENAARAHDNS
ncbi:origin recognition complex subunit 6-like [Mercenaria mercenaria]|uniref:origin recognition complex subunit 6-like n=1 Tax=Mercenaria mercenaria TaxID=6596 RepID=UPI00234F329F|nr:origin recognition complex subunit 6-like [Mercenaria mercenaria]